jgi:gas vesicle protein
VRNIADLPSLTVKQILKWVDKHHKRTGEWPMRTSGEVTGALGETWLGIDVALLKGNRGLPGGSTVARLLAEHRGVRNRMDLPKLTIKQILQWADKHHQRTGEWPKVQSGKVVDGTGETWAGIDMALQQGSRGLPGGSSVARLLAEHRGVRNRMDLPKLTIKQILQWVDKYHRRTGEWPNVKSGKVTDAPGETWSGIHSALYAGLRGFPGGSSVARLLAEHRGVRNPRDLPMLTERKILQWADKHYRRTGRWPIEDSGKVTDAAGETWTGISIALQRGSRGLPGGSSLAKLMSENRRKKT